MSDFQLVFDNVIFPYFDHFKDEHKQDIYELQKELNKNMSSYIILPDSYDKSFFDEYLTKITVYCC